MDLKYDEWGLLVVVTLCSKEMFSFWQDQLDGL